MSMPWQTIQQDTIHFSAQVFRQLLDAFARPGTIVQLPNREDAGRFSTIDHPHAIAAVATLLDNETTFTVASDGEWLPASNEVVRWLLEVTTAKVSDPSQCTFAVLLDATFGSLIGQLPLGTLNAPELSATAFICVDALGDEPVDDTTMTLELRGPGIQEMTLLSIAGLQPDDVAKLHQTRRELPLGIDVYLIDRSGRCAGLPRSTRIVQRSR